MIQIVIHITHTYNDTNILHITNTYNDPNSDTHHTHL